MGKKSFTELVKQFEAWYGYVNCRDSKNPEEVMTLFLWYLANLPRETFDYRKFQQLTARRQIDRMKKITEGKDGPFAETVQQVSDLADKVFALID